MKKFLKIFLLVLLLVFFFLLWRAATLYTNTSSPSVNGVISDFPRQFLLNPDDDVQNSGHGYGGTAAPGSFYLSANIASSTSPQEEYQLYLNYFQNNGYTITHQDFNSQDDDPTGEIFAQNNDYSVIVIIDADISTYFKSNYQVIKIDIDPTLEHFILHGLF